jgi:hypothetical protein
MTHQIETQIETQIEKDLIKHARERLQRWAIDTRSVFRMAELGDSKAASCIIVELMGALAEMMSVCNLSSTELEQLLDAATKQQNKKRAGP